MINSNLYPYKFHPIYKDKIWGGNKLKTELNKQYHDLPNCGESWEISGVPGDLSIVSNGPLSGQSLPELIDQLGPELLGQRVMDKFGTEFPLLVKFIDANDDLSIQVHPADDIARQRHNSFGKTEMWYIINRDPGAFLYTGFSKEVSKEEFADYSMDARVLDVLNKESVEPGDVYFLPAGRVHSIGKGILLAEIQQTSDVTYRVYDFDRVDDQGNKRELHIQEALDVMDFTIEDDYKSTYDLKRNAPANLVDCPYFTTNLLDLDKHLAIDMSGTDSFRIYLCLEGQSVIRYQSGRIDLAIGESVLVPAAMGSLEIQPDPSVKLLESYIA